jgi:hypothetical protein
MTAPAEVSQNPYLTIGNHVQVSTRSTNERGLQSHTFNDPFHLTGCRRQFYLFTHIKVVGKNEPYPGKYIGDQGSRPQAKGGRKQADK